MLEVRKRQEEEQVELVRREVDEVHVDAVEVGEVGVRGSGAVAASRRGSREVVPQLLVQAALKPPTYMHTHIEGTSLAIHQQRPT